jgi:transcriptional regulator with XRE-family HTH domain
MPSADAKAVVPPNLSMMSDVVMDRTFAENAIYVKDKFADCAIDNAMLLVQAKAMLNTAELLARLDAKEIRNRDIARVLGINDSRVTEIKQGRRQVKLEEAAKLVEVFQLEPDSPASPLPPPILRLVILYVGMVLGVESGRVQRHLEELTEDLRAFSEFAADPKVRRSIDAAEGFFRAMLVRRPRPGSEAPQGTDRELSD